MTAKIRKTIVTLSIVAIALTACGNDNRDLVTIGNNTKNGVSTVLNIMCEIEALDGGETAENCQ